jgi:hypothetical protein
VGGVTPIVLHRYDRFCVNARVVFVNPAAIATWERVDADPGRKTEYTRIELIGGTTLNVTEDPERVIEEIHYADVANARLVVERN